MCHFSGQRTETLLRIVFNKNEKRVFKKLKNLKLRFSRKIILIFDYVLTLAKVSKTLTAKHDKLFGVLYILRRFSVQ